MLLPGPCCELRRRLLLWKVCLATFAASRALAANTCDVPPRCNCRENQFQDPEVPLVASCLGRTCSADVKLNKLQSQRMVTLPKGIANISVKLTAPVDLDLMLQDSVTGSCVAGAPCDRYNNGCPVKGDECIPYENMSWYFSGDDSDPPIEEVLRSTRSITKEMDIKVQASATGVGTVTLSNAPMADCPAVMPGCKPCSEYQGCAKGEEFPRCTGCSQVTCVRITHTTTSATFTSTTASSVTSSVTSISITTSSTSETSLTSTTSTSVTIITSTTFSSTATSTTSTVSTYTRTTSTHSSTTSTVSTSTSISATTTSDTSTETTTSTASSTVLTSTTSISTSTSSWTESTTVTTVSSSTSSATSSSSTSTTSSTKSTSVSSTISSTSSTSVTTTVSTTSSTVSSSTSLTLSTTSSTVSTTSSSTRSASTTSTSATSSTSTTSSSTISTSTTSTVTISSSTTTTSTTSTSVTETYSSTTSTSTISSSTTSTSSTSISSTQTNSSTTDTLSTTSVSTRTTRTQTATESTTTTSTTWTASQTTSTTSTPSATTSSTSATLTKTDTTTTTLSISATTTTSSSISITRTTTTSASNTTTKTSTDTTLTSTSSSTTTTSTCGCCSYCAAPVCNSFQAYCDASRSQGLLQCQQQLSEAVANVTHAVLKKERKEASSADASTALFVASLVLLSLEACVALYLCVQWKKQSGETKSDTVEHIDSILPVGESELQYLVDQQKQQIEMLQRQVTQLQQKLDKAHQALDTEQRSRKNLQQRNLELTHQNTALADGKKTLEQLCSDLEMKLRKSNAERQALEGSLIESQHTLRGLKAGMEPLAAGNDLQQRLEASQNRQRSLEEQLQDHKQLLQQSENKRQVLDNRLEQYKAALVGKAVPPSAYVEDSLHRQQQHIDSMQLTLQKMQHDDSEKRDSRSLAQSLNREIAATHQHIQDILHCRDEPKSADALRHPGSVVDSPPRRAPLRSEAGSVVHSPPHTAPFHSEPVLAAPPLPAQQSPPAYPPMRLG